MKKILSKATYPIILLVIAALFLAFYVYMIARPISYGMEYHFKGTVLGYEFETTTVFKTNNKALFINESLEEPQESYYYYHKGGWIFMCYAANEEEYLAEVERIKADLEGTQASEMYAFRISAFSYSYGDPADGSEVVQTCAFAKNFAVVGALVELFLIAITAVAFTRRKKAN